MKNQVTLEVLMATIDQKDYSLLKRINLQSDIIVCNQKADTTSLSTFDYNGFNVRWYNFEEKGVGLNRNSALMRSVADICLLADDDVVYIDGYREKIIEAFDSHPNVDMILFNIVSDIPRFECKREMRVSLVNCGRFGGVRIAFRRLAVLKNAISFNCLFGGGSMFSAGEDNMFIRDCIRKGLKVIALPITILSLESNRASTWFVGYDEKFFNDLGSSYLYHYGKLAPICCALQLFKHRKLFLTGIKYVTALRLAFEGINKYKRLR